jgi:hypothetical protein
MNNSLTKIWVKDSSREGKLLKVKERFYIRLLVVVLWLKKKATYFTENTSLHGGANRGEVVVGDTGVGLLSNKKQGQPLGGPLLSSITEP